MVPTVNGDDVFEFPEKKISLIHSTFTLAVDTFLLMGGLLATWSFLNALDKSVPPTSETKTIFHIVYFLYQGKL